MCPMRGASIDLYGCSMKSGDPNVQVSLNNFFGKMSPESGKADNGGFYIILTGTLPKTGTLFLGR